LEANKKIVTFSKFWSEFQSFALAETEVWQLHQLT